MTLVFSFSARASSSRDDDIHRIEDSAQIFQEIMGTPDKAIPQYLLDSAQCIAIIPSEMKFAFFVGGNYGKGLVTCRVPRAGARPCSCPLAGEVWGSSLAGRPPTSFWFSADAEDWTNSFTINSGSAVTFLLPRDRWGEALSRHGY